jgi:hypothetical protein
MFKELGSRYFKLQVLSRKALGTRFEFQVGSRKLKVRSWQCPSRKLAVGSHQGLESIWWIVLISLIVLVSLLETRYLVGLEGDRRLVCLPANLQHISISLRHPFLL